MTTQAMRQGMLGDNVYSSFIRTITVGSRVTLDLLTCDHACSRAYQDGLPPVRNYTLP